MKYYILGLAAMVMLIALSACGGGGGTDGGSTGGDLSGNVNVGTFSIAAGETRRVTGDLVLHASKDINIAGTLLVDPGVNMVLSAKGEVMISGNVEVVSNARSRGGEATAWVMDGADLSLPTGATVTCGGSLTFVAAESLFGSRGSLTINGTASAGEGLFGLVRGGPGDPGSSVEIGTQAALDTLIRVDPSQAGRTVRRYKNVTINGSITAGAGGHGYDDLLGQLTGDSLVGLAGDGGKGGRFAVSAIESVTIAAGATARAGIGGRGGVTGSSSATLAAPKGMALAESGKNLRATTGTGGAGGDFVFLSEAGSNPKFNGAARIARGGNNGSAFVAAGNGGPAGLGGNTEVFVGLTGKPGQGGTLLAEANTEATVNCLSGGNGGNSPKENFRGGRGGNVTIVGRDNQQAKVSKIDFKNYANGGEGFSDCFEPPYTPGSDGGKAQRLNTKRYPYEDDKSFNGGDGGNGAPPGVGGAAGFDDSNNAIGNPGDDGKRCADG